MYAKPAQPLSSAGVVYDAIRLYRASFNRAWIPALVMQLLISSAFIYVRIHSPELLDAKDMADNVRKLAPAVIGIYLIAVVVSLIFSNAITAQLLAVRDGQDLSIGDSVTAGVRFFLRTFAAGVLLGAGGAIATGAAGVSLAALPGVWRTVQLVLYLLLGIYIIGRVCLASVAVIADGTGAAGSIRASWRLTRHHGWRAVTIMAAVSMVFIAVLFVLQLVAGVLYLMVRTDTMSGLLAVQLVSAVIQAVTVPFLNAGLVCIHADLKLRSLGADLASSLGTLENL